MNEFYVVFSTDRGKYLLPNNDHDRQHYDNLFRRIVDSTSTRRHTVYPMGACINLAPDVMCIIDRQDDEAESRLKPKVLVDFILDVARNRDRKTIVFLPILRQNYIINSKYVCLLLNENVQIVFV